MGTVEFNQSGTHRTGQVLDYHTLPIVTYVLTVIVLLLFLYLACTTKENNSSSAAALGPSRSLCMFCGIVSVYYQG